MSKQIVDAIGIKRALMRMTYEIVERNKGTKNLVLIGIKTRGLYLAQRIAGKFETPGRRRHSCRCPRYFQVS